MVDESISDKLDRLEQLLSQKQTKSFKFPKLSKAKIKKGYCLVQVLRTNGFSRIYKLPIDDNVVKIPSVDSKELGTYHQVQADEVFQYKKYPLVIIPEWDMKPVSKERLLQQAQEEGTMTFAEKYIFTKMKKDLIVPKKFNAGSIILILLVIGGLLIAGNQFGLFG